MLSVWTVNNFMYRVTKWDTPRAVFKAVYYLLFFFLLQEGLCAICQEGGGGGMACCAAQIHEVCLVDDIWVGHHVMCPCCRTPYPIPMVQQLMNRRLDLHPEDRVKIENVSTSQYFNFSRAFKKMNLGSITNNCIKYFVTLIFSF